MTHTKNQNNQFTTITIEDEDPLNIMNHSSSLLEDDNGKSFLMDDDETFLLSSPESSPEHSQNVPATPPHELYNILQNITTQPTQSQHLIQQPLSNDIPPFGVVDLHGTMFAAPIAQQPNFYATPQDFFPHVMGPSPDFSAYFSPHPQLLVPPPIIQAPQINIKGERKTSPISSTVDENDDDEHLDSPRGSDNSEPPKKRRKRKNEEIDEDNDRLNELCSKPNAQLTEEEKQEKRRLRNRQTAQRSRNNQKVKLDLLERENNDLKKKNAKLTMQLEESNRQCEMLRKENQMLKDKISKNVTIDLPPALPPAQPALKNSQKATLLMAIIFCVGCTFFLGNLLGEKGLTRAPVASIASLAIPANARTAPSTITATTTAASQSERKTLATRTLLQVKNTTEYCKLDDSVCYDKNNDDVIDDGQMDLPTQPISFDFDSTGMTKTNIFYPNKIKRHFGIKDDEPAERPQEQQQQQQKASEAQTTTSPQASQELVAVRPHKRLTIDHNNKQLIRMSENSFFENMREKKHKYSMGALYQFPSPIEEEEAEDDKKTIHLFCPFIYPMLPNDSGDDMDSFAGLHGGLVEDTRIKIHVPVQMLNKTTNNKVIRLAEITGENMSLSESYFELDAALTPTTTADGTIKPERE
jgi:hypothetical protein